MECTLEASSSPSKRSFHSLKFILCIPSVILILVVFYIQASTLDSSSNSPSSTSWAFFDQWRRAVTTSPSNHSQIIESMTARLRALVTFLPLKDLRFSETPTAGNTWFMSSLNDTSEANEADHLLFPSPSSNGRLLCVKGNNSLDGTKNFYALAWAESLPDSATLLEGLTFVSDTFYNYHNPWHGLCAMTPFVRWSMKNECIKPTRWLLYHWGEQKLKMGSWIQNLMEANYKDMKIKNFDRGDRPYCFEKAVVIRHDIRSMAKENKLKVMDLLRCKARGFCGFNPSGRGNEVNERGVPIVRLTLLMRRGSRSFKNATAVFDIFAKECAKVDGCILEMVHSDDLSFCDQVRVMMNTDVLASPHGAQLTNMMFMDRDSSVMEFFPKGWLKTAGAGQYVYHWMADMSGMKHQGAWRDEVGDECPLPEEKLKCFYFHKDGKVGHNETYFAEWTSKVLSQVRISKLQQASGDQNTMQKYKSNACVC